jgi:hypothetical protein
VTYVDSDNPASSIAEQDIGKASRGGSNIQGALADNIDISELI